MPRELLTEEQAQEIIDDFVIKLRIVRFLRILESDELFAGDPTWVGVQCRDATTTMGNGMPVTVAKATEGRRRYRHGLQTTKSGFTLGGGEPLMQHRFAVKLLTAARRAEAATKLWRYNMRP